MKATSPSMTRPRARSSALILLFPRSITAADAWRLLQSYTVLRRARRRNRKGTEMKSIKVVDKIELWDINRLILYARNPVIHSKTQVAQIKASIERFGMINPILVDSHGNVIAGHGVILAAKSMGLTHLAVIVLDHLTDAELRALRIAHNRIAENRAWDKALLSERTGGTARSKNRSQIVGL
jgi:hypothetical protein